MVNLHSLELVETEGNGKKLVQRAVGPFEIMEKISPTVYCLRLPDNYPMHPIINSKHLRKYHFSPPDLGPRESMPPVRPELKNLEIYEVEAILEH